MTTASVLWHYKYLEHSSSFCSLRGSFENSIRSPE